MCEGEPIGALAKQQASPVEFSVKLESLRGLAALLVVGHHVLPAGWFHILFNGTAAVSLFFLLSGYVLGLSLRRGRGTIFRQYTSFIIRRLFRIYPVYVATTLMFLAYWAWYPFAPSLTTAISSYPYLHLGLLKTLKSFCLLDQSLNPVTWSLKVEMAGSILLPVIHFLNRGWRWPGRMALLAAMVSLSFLVPNGSPTRQNIYMFYLGYLVIDLEADLPRLPRGVATMLIAVGVAGLLTARTLIGDVVPHYPIILFMEAISGAAIILAIQAGGRDLGGVLSHPWSRFAGRVSYSVFLVHLLIADLFVNGMLLSPMKALQDHAGTLLFRSVGLALSVPLVLLVSRVLYQWVEAPCMKLGKTLGAVVAARGARE